MLVFHYSIYVVASARNVKFLSIAMYIPVYHVEVYKSLIMYTLTH